MVLNKGEQEEQRGAKTEFCQERKRPSLPHDYSLERLRKGGKSIRTKTFLFFIHSAKRNQHVTLCVQQAENVFLCFDCSDFERLSITTNMNGNDCYIIKQKESN